MVAAINSKKISSGISMMNGFGLPTPRIRDNRESNEGHFRRAMKHIVSRSTQESKELKRSQETYFPQVQGTSLPTVDLDSMIGYEATHHGERSRPRYMSQVLPNAPMVTETHPSASNSERKSVRGDKRRARYASNAQVLSSPRSSLRSPLLFSHHLSCGIVSF